MCSSDSAVRVSFHKNNQLSWTADIERPQKIPEP